MQNRTDNPGNFDTDKFIHLVDGAAHPITEIVEIFAPHLNKLHADDIAYIARTATRAGRLDVLKFLDSDARCQLLFKEDSKLRIFVVPNIIGHHLVMERAFDLRSYGPVSIEDPGPPFEK